MEMPSYEGPAEQRKWVAWKRLRTFAAMLPGGGGTSIPFRRAIELEGMLDLADAWADLDGLLAVYTPEELKRLGTKARNIGYAQGKNQPAILLNPFLLDNDPDLLFIVALVDSFVQYKLGDPEILHRLKAKLPFQLSYLSDVAVRELAGEAASFFSLLTTYEKWRVRFPDVRNRKLEELNYLLWSDAITFHEAVALHLSEHFKLSLEQGLDFLRALRKSGLLAEWGLATLCFGKLPANEPAEFFAEEN